MSVKKSAWEPERHRPYDSPSLESVLERVAKAGEFPIPIEDGMLREKTSDETAVHIRSLPRIVWDTIRYISMTYPAESIQLKSVAEGCLIHCGLNVIEGLFDQTLGSNETWLQAYLNGNTNTLLDFIGQRYITEYLGHGINHTRKVFFLNKNDKARAMEVSTKYGLSLSAVATLTMIAGIAQSVSFLPGNVVEPAVKELERFSRWLKGTKYK